MKPQARTLHRTPLHGHALLGHALLGHALLLAGILGTGCGGRTPWGSWDAGPGADAASPPDAAPPVDARPDPDGSVQCTEGEWWALMASPVHEAYLQSPHGWMTDGMAQGISARLRVNVAVGGCDRLAGVQVAVDWEARQVFLRSYVWAYRGPDACPFDLRLEPEVWALPDLTPGEWSVWDAHTLGGPALARFVVRDCMDGEDCLCYLWDGIPGTHGAQCQFDCQCEWQLECVYEGQLDPSWGGICAQTCSTHSDCPMPMMCVFNWEDIPEGYCTMERDRCEASAECREGFSCLPGPDDPRWSYCQADMEVVLQDIRCEEDCDCPWGYSCTEMTDAMIRSCQIPCRGNGDCPEELMCDEVGGFFQNVQVCSGWWD